MELLLDFVNKQFSVCKEDKSQSLVYRVSILSEVWQDSDLTSAVFHKDVWETVVIRLCGTARVNI